MSQEVAVTMLPYTYLLTTTVMIKYCLPNHYNAYHMQFTIIIIIITKPEPKLISLFIF